VTPSVHRPRGRLHADVTSPGANPVTAASRRAEARPATRRFGQLRRPSPGFSETLRRNAFRGSRHRADRQMGGLLTLHGQGSAVGAGFMPVAEPRSNQSQDRSQGEPAPPQGEHSGIALPPPASSTGRPQEPHCMLIAGKKRTALSYERRTASRRPEGGQGDRTETATVDDRSRTRPPESPTSTRVTTTATARGHRPRSRLAHRPPPITHAPATQLPMSTCRQVRWWR
jgi:hypothetical protein